MSTVDYSNSSSWAARAKSSISLWLFQRIKVTRWFTGKSIDSITFWRCITKVIFVSTPDLSISELVVIDVVGPRDQELVGHVSCSSH